jgi:hypothetical protein
MGCFVMVKPIHLRRLAPNKNIMLGILLAEKALLKSPYVKRYVQGVYEI